MDTTLLLGIAAIVATLLGILLGAAVISRPHLRKDVYTDHATGTFTISLKNSGKGGATVLNMELVAYDISSNDYDIDDFVTRMAQPINMRGNPGIEFNVYDSGNIVAPGEERKIFEAVIPKQENDLAVTFFCLEKNLCLKGKYKSILGQRFEI